MTREAPDEEAPFRPFETDLDREDTLKTLRGAVAAADDGEVFLERRRAESLVFDDGRLRGASYDSSRGFGLRAVAGPVAGYAHSTDLTAAALRRAAETARLAAAEGESRIAPAPALTNQRLYPQESPLTTMSFGTKVDILKEIDDYLRTRDSRVVQVSASLAGELQEVEILRPEGNSLAEARPLVRMSISVIVEKDGRRESGSSGGGGRMSYETMFAPEAWKAMAEEALRIALVNLKAEDAPAGVMEVALGAGWPGILLHEAIGHGLEGDFNRKKTSAFSGLMGQRVAAPGVTVVDDGTIPGRRGSLSFDDEGTPTGRTVLIEDGILTGYMQDRQNARLMGMAPTGNGRRQSFAHIPMPRMTNTIMMGGEAEPSDVVAAVKDGIYAVGFGGGQVDIVNGKFVFSCTEAYRVKDGKVLHPVKGATLIGDGPTALGRVRMIANDMALDPGIGTCGKNGQGVPVGVGQPTLLIDGLTVGGAAA